MRSIWFVALIVGLGIGFSAGQQTSPSAPPPMPDTLPAKVMVYTMGPGVTAPELLPVTQTPIPNEKCKKKVKSMIPISLYVDAEGVPRDLNLLYPKELKLDEMALKIVAADWFKPGTYKGLPVPVAETVVVTLYACMAEKKDSSGQQTDQVRLWSLPEQNAIPLQKSPEIDDIASIGALEKVGGKVSAPVIVHSVVPEFTDEARRAKYWGVVLVSIIVDAQGMPRDLHVVHPIGMGLDQKAIEAVKKFRFKPAMKDGKPVPVKVTIEVNFRLYTR
ncbi:MAG TPA: energy transducer TonB [Terracidiphilus sp.]|nr:energy transducer TonB [Terracidiphilus sp.]